MNGKDRIKFLIDSNIIIYHLNNDEIATSFLIKNFEKCGISLITYIEVLSFNFENSQFDNVKEFLENFHIYEIDKKISIQAINNRKKKKIKIPDNLIASTAQVNNLTLITRNVDDYTSINVTLKNIYE